MIKIKVEMEIKKRILAEYLSASTNVRMCIVELGSSTYNSIENRERKTTSLPLIAYWMLHNSEEKTSAKCTVIFQRISHPI